MLFHTSVLSLASGESTRPESAAISRRAHAGCAAERVHFKAGIVGDHQLAGRETRIVNSLGRRVGQKRVAVFFRRSDLFDAGKRIDAD